MVFSRNLFPRGHIIDSSDPPLFIESSTAISMIPLQAAQTSTGTSNNGFQKFQRLQETSSESNRVNCLWNFKA